MFLNASLTSRHRLPSASLITPLIWPTVSLAPSRIDCTSGGVNTGGREVNSRSKKLVSVSPVFVQFSHESMPSVSRMLTTLGTKSGCSSLLRTLLQSMSAKNTCFIISSPSLAPQPSRLLQSRTSSSSRMERAETDKVVGRLIG